jgi:hypothetical protein
MTLRHSTWKWLSNTAYAEVEAMRTFLVAVLVWGAASPAYALEVPQFQNGGFHLGLQVGGSLPQLDRAGLEKQAPNAKSLLSTVPADAFALGFRLSYNVMGYASAGVDFSATGWNVFTTTRGGAGFLVGMLAIHPLQFFYINKGQRPLGLDVSTHFGVGYGIAGGGSEAGLWGIDGLILQWGTTIDYFLNRYFGLQFFVKGNFMRWDRFYYDWDAAHQAPDNTMYSSKLPQTSGGSWWVLGGALVLRIGG